MPTFRSDIGSISPYVPGRPIEDVAREIGMDPGKVVKLASNESPDGPFPGVVEAAIETLAESNRYPDNDVHDLALALSQVVGIPTDHLWFGAGSTGLIMSISAAVGGPGTSVVYAWPSFVMYRIVSRIAMTEAIEVPLDTHMAHDLEAMRAAVRENTTLVYVCNPNNPTGTLVDSARVEEFIDSLPESVLVVVDEAYHHYVDDVGYHTLIPFAAERPNVVVLRTFSKVYGLASHRIGVAIGPPVVLTELRKMQAPFSVGQVAQAAARYSLGNDAELARRVAANSIGRQMLFDGFVELGLKVLPSQANFVFARPTEDSNTFAAGLMDQGVIVRPMSNGWIRVTVGNAAENQRMIDALESALSSKITQPFDRPLI